MQKLLLLAACVTSSSLARRVQHSEASSDPSVKTLASLLASDIPASGFNAGAVRANTLSSRFDSPAMADAAEKPKPAAKAKKAKAPVNPLYTEATEKGIVRGSVVRILRRESYWYRQLGSVATVVKKAGMYPIVVKFSKQNYYGIKTTNFAPSEVEFVEGPPAKKAKAKAPARASDATMSLAHDPEAAEVEETLGSLYSATAAVQGATKGEKLALRKQLFAGALAVAVALQPPNAAHAGDIAAGANVFNANCVACHRGGQNVILAEKTLQKEALEEYLDGGFSEASIVKQVTNGKNGMPAFGGRLGDSEIGNVAAFVYDQASNAKWDED